MVQLQQCNTPCDAPCSYNCSADKWPKMAPMTQERSSGRFKNLEIHQRLCRHHVRVNRRESVVRSTVFASTRLNTLPVTPKKKICQRWEGCRVARQCQKKRNVLEIFSAAFVNNGYYFFKKFHNINKQQLSQVWLPFHLFKSTDFKFYWVFIQINVCLVLAN